jgi:hypothetical protein
LHRPYILDFIFITKLVITFIYWKWIIDIFNYGNSLILNFLDQQRLLLLILEKRTKYLIKIFKILKPNLERWECLIRLMLEKFLILMILFHFLKIYLFILNYLLLFGLLILLKQQYQFLFTFDCLLNLFFHIWQDFLDFFFNVIWL